VKYSKPAQDKRVQIAQSEFSRLLDMVIEKLCFGRADELPPDLQERVGRRMHMLVSQGQPLVNRCYARPKREAARNALLVAAASLFDPHWSVEQRAKVIADIVQGKISKHTYPDVYEKISAAEDIDHVPRTTRQIATILRESGAFASHARGDGKTSL